MMRLSGRKGSGARSQMGAALAPLLLLYGATKPSKLGSTEPRAFVERSLLRCFCSIAPPSRASSALRGSRASAEAKRGKRKGEARNGSWLGVSRLSSPVSRPGNQFGERDVALRRDLLGTRARVDAGGFDLGDVGDLAQGVREGLAALAECGAHDARDEVDVPRGSLGRRARTQPHDRRLDFWWWLERTRRHVDQGLDFAGQLQHHRQTPV